MLLPRFLSTDGLLLPALLLLEIVLSADNALALAALVQPVESKAERERLLNWGLATGVGLRLLAVVVAGSLLHHPLLRLLGGGVLIWLALGHFRRELQAGGNDPTPEPQAAQPPGVPMVLLIGATNLAFSLDSICAALALTDSIPLVMAAGTLGAVVLRWVAGWILGWMERFPNLSNAAYLTVLSVGLRLVVEQVAPSLAPSEPLMVGGMLVLLGWGLWAPQPARP